ncbi:MAG: hypothetical protein JXM70_23640 [Pirellulales bacterium]|nr:hypothetical protein [Pirellulales bacterium]
MGKKWSLCDDIIDPLATELYDTVQQWHIIGRERPRPQNIEWMYKERHVEFAVSWLKLNVSVDFAGDFQNKLNDLLDLFKKLHFRSLQILDGDIDGTAKTATFRHDAIRRVYDERYAWLKYNLPQEKLENFDPDEDEILGPFSMQEGQVEQAFRDTVEYLRQTSALLRAKFAKKTDNGNNAISPTWYHSPDELKPEHFAFGPLNGTMKDLDLALSGKGKNGLQIKGKNKRGTIWVIGRQYRAFEVWFKTQGDYSAAFSKFDSQKVNKTTTSVKSKSR